MDYLIDLLKLIACAIIAYAVIAIVITIGRNSPFVSVAIIASIYASFRMKTRKTYNERTTKDGKTISCKR